MASCIKPCKKFGLCAIEPCSVLFNNPMNSLVIEAHVFFNQELAYSRELKAVRKQAAAMLHNSPQDTVVWLLHE